MAQRETIAQTALQKWRGVDQRTQPTLVKDGFFSMAKGIFFGLGENVERIPGKRLSGKLNTPIFQIWQFDKTALVQTNNALLIVPIEELTTFVILYPPAAPDVPTFSAISFFTLTVHVPTFPARTDSFTLQRSTDEVNWTTIATGLASLQTFADSGLIDDTEYFYRVVGVNIYATTNGPSANVSTVPRLPDAPIAPTLLVVGSDAIDVTAPILPAYAVTMNLQESTDGVTFATVATGYIGGEVYHATGLNPLFIYTYRMVGVNTKGTTNGASVSQALVATVDDETGDPLQDEGGDDIEADF